jgi:uncharacterized protein YbjT (DUF2867 family)
MTILVTGASGNIGRSLVEDLVGRRRAVRVTTRDPAAHVFPGSVEVRVSGLDDAGSFTDLLDGIDKLFFLAPESCLGAQARIVAEAVDGSSVRQIVMVSSLSAEMPSGNSLGDHHVEAEQVLRGTGIPLTILRGGVFATNALRWAPTIRSQGVAYCLVRNEPVAVIDPGDIGLAAAAVLTSDGHEGEIYGLTGPEAVTPEQQVAIIGDLLGKPIGFETLTQQEAIAMASRYAASPEAAEALMNSLWQPDLPWLQPRPDAGRLIGHPPSAFADWVRSNMDAFK